jgi:tetratricopeptide (TPR) repeat protein
MKTPTRPASLSAVFAWLRYNLTGLIAEDGCMSKAFIGTTCFALASAGGAHVFRQFSIEAQRVQDGCSLEYISLILLVIYLLPALFVLSWALRKLIKKADASPIKIRLNPFLGAVLGISWLALPLCAWLFLDNSDALFYQARGLPASPEVRHAALLQNADNYQRLFGNSGFTYVYERYAESSFYSRDLVEAEWAWRQAIEHSDKPVKKDDWRTLRGLQRLGQVNMKQRRFHHALDAYTQVFQACASWTQDELAALPPVYQRQKDWLEAQVGAAMAICYMQLGEYTKAETILKQQVALEERLYGRSHSLKAIEALADTYIALKKYKEAEAYCREAIQIRETELKESARAGQVSRINFQSSDLGDSYGRLARVLHQLGQLEEAQKYDALGQSAGNPTKPPG